MNISILVADDFVPWRRFVSLVILSKKPEWRIVCEVSDGEEAIKKAAEFRPDMILLDIGLPKLNGIDAARQISKIAPGSKILFLSAFDSQEIVEKALNTGASGYVVKLDAAGELVGALEAVLQGKQFISSTFKRGISGRAEDARAPDKIAHDGFLAS